MLTSLGGWIITMGNKCNDMEAAKDTMIDEKMGSPQLRICHENESKPKRNHSYFTHMYPDLPTGMYSKFKIIQ